MSLLDRFCQTTSVTKTWNDEKLLPIKVKSLACTARLKSSCQNLQRLVSWKCLMSLPRVVTKLGVPERSGFEQRFLVRE